jgi:hypothetical protein
VPARSRADKLVVFDRRGFGTPGDAAGGPGRSHFVEDLRAPLVAQSLRGGTCTGSAGSPTTD